jgi:hypothetical protein
LGSTARARELLRGSRFQKFSSHSKGRSRFWKMASESRYRQVLCSLRMVEMTGAFFHEARRSSGFSMATK